MCNEMSSKETLYNCPVCQGEGRLRQDLERPDVKISVPCKMCGEKEGTIEIPGWSEQVLFCESCAKEWNDDQKRIDELQKQGHSHHCACRQVWGDGECECALYAKGYDPYAWLKGEYVREIPIGHHSKMAGNGPDVPQD